MKKIITLILLTLALVLCLAACGENNEETQTTATEIATTDAAQGIDTTSADADEVTTSETTDTAAQETATEEATTEEITTEEETTLNTLLPSADIAVMSFNLDANESTIATRAKYMIPLMLEYEPDSIGVQECRGSWNDKITKGLKSKYARVGVAADGTKQSNSAFATYIFYLKDKYDLVDSGTFWLSKTPDTPSKYSDTVDCNRTCTWAILENKETGYRYAHINCHLDWMDVEATDYQIAMVREQIARFDAMGIPTFATGDFNTDEKSSTYNIMLENTNIADSKFIATKTMSLATYHDNGKYDMETTLPIDFCFVTKNRVTVNEYKVIYETQPNGDYISDHNGLIVYATIKETEDTYITANAPDVSGVKLSATSVGTAKVTVVFNQASDTAPIEYYNVTAADKDGKTVSSVKVSSNYRAYEYNEKDLLTADLTRLATGTEYTISVTAVNLFGKESQPVTLNVTTAASVEAQDPGAADLFDLAYEGGKFVDKSAKGLDITAVGTVTHTDDALAVFGGKGNLKAPGFKNCYSLLSDGFSIETYVKFNDVTTFADIISNMHAGGFGISVENGNLEFDVHVGGEYKGTSVAINADEWYHIIAVYDGSQVTIYLNGQLASSAEVSGKMGFATDEGAKYLCIGADSDATGAGEYPAKAEIKSARVYSIALTDGQALGAYLQIN